MERNASQAAFQLPQNFYRHQHPPQDSLSQSISYWEEYSFNNRQSLQQALHTHEQESLNYNRNTQREDSVDTFRTNQSVLERYQSLVSELAGMRLEDVLRLFAEEVEENTQNKQLINQLKNSNQSLVHEVEQQKGLLQKKKEDIEKLIHHQNQQLDIIEHITKHVRGIPPLSQGAYQRRYKELEETIHQYMASNNQAQQEFLVAINKLTHHNKMLKEQNERRVDEGLRMQRALEIAQVKMHGMKKDMKEWKMKEKEWKEEKKGLEMDIEGLIERLAAVEQEWKVEGERVNPGQQAEISSSLEWLRNNNQADSQAVTSRERETELKNEIVKQSKLISRLQTEKQALIDQNEHLKVQKQQSCGSQSSASNKVESLSTNSHKFMQSLEQKNNYIQELTTGLLTQQPTSETHSSKPAQQSNSICRHSDAKPVQEHSSHQSNNQEQESLDHYNQTERSPLLIQEERDTERVVSKANSRVLKEIAVNGSLGTLRQSKAGIYMHSSVKHREDPSSLDFCSASSANSGMRGLF